MVGEALGFQDTIIMLLLNRTHNIRLYLTRLLYRRNRPLTQVNPNIRVRRCTLLVSQFLFVLVKQSLNNTCFFFGYDISFRK